MKVLLKCRLACWSALLWSILLLGGCGFELRGVTTIPAELIPIYVQSGPSSPIRSVLIEAMHTNGLLTTDDPKVANLIIRILTEGHSSRVAAVNNRGKVIGSELHYQVVFDGLGLNEQPIIKRQSIDLARDYINPEIEVLGKTEEAETIQRELEHDMADRILHRLRVLLHAKRS